MRQMPELKIEIPSPVQEILNTLRTNGYEACIVGGCVRDALLGRVPGDWDITTSALPHEVKALFRSTVDTGIQHGTVLVILNGEGFEVTTYRIDGAYEDSRHPSSVTFTRSLEEDLKRRDFTINAFALNEEGLVDLFDGLSDLQKGLIRCVGDPAERFREDALRIMRAVRFSAQLGFEIEERTAAMIRTFSPSLAQISMERIRVEWEKTLLSDHPCLVNRYAGYGMAPYIIKNSWEKCFDPSGDALLEELLRRREQTGFYRPLMLAAFFRNLSPEEADQAFRELKYDNRTREAVTKILRFSDLPVDPDRAGIRQQLNRMGAETFFSILEMKDAMLCCGAFRNGERAEAGRARITKMRETAEDIIVCGEPFQISQLAVNGKDLMEAGVPAGKKIGLFLEKILQKVMQSPTLNNKAILCSHEFLSEVENECKDNL
ncbi:MAG: CCA tRNA nucleotidyltransferase [Parasporobacterium sp.]|nr:CCA tRNA nucleotidyltransferase [Parasporobacterium sp.]